VDEQVIRDRSSGVHSLRDIYGDRRTLRVADYRALRQIAALGRKVSHGNDEGHAREDFTDTVCEADLIPLEQQSLWLEITQAAAFRGHFHETLRLGRKGETLMENHRMGLEVRRAEWNRFHSFRRGGCFCCTRDIVLGCTFPATKDRYGATIMYFHPLPSAANRLNVAIHIGSAYNDGDGKARGDVERNMDAFIAESKQDLDAPRYPQRVAVRVGQAGIMPHRFHEIFPSRREVRRPYHGNSGASVDDNSGRGQNVWVEANGTQDHVVGGPEKADKIIRGSNRALVVLTEHARGHHRCLDRPGTPCGGVQCSLLRGWRFWMASSIRQVPSGVRHRGTPRYSFPESSESEEDEEESDASLDNGVPYGVST